MRAPLGRAAVFAALLTLRTCLTGKEALDWLYNWANWAASSSHAGLY